MAFAACLASAAGGAWLHHKFGPKPKADVITERVPVPTLIQRPTDCSKNGLLEYYRACHSQKRMELVKPKG